MPRQRRILIGGVGFVRHRIRNPGRAMAAVCSELEPVLESSGWFPEAPFETVHLIFRFSGAPSAQTIIDSIDQLHSELPVSRELEAGPLEQASRAPEALRQALLRETLDVLWEVSAKFSLPAITFRPGS